MTQSRLGLTLVMDEADELVGIVTDGDLRRALLDNPSVVMEEVRAFMTPDPHTILDSAQLSEAESYMRENKVRALAVLNAQGREVVGVVEIFD